MKKFYTLFIITLLACINIVLVGYSTFYFNTEVSNSPNVDVAVNNIAQNYGRSENSNDYFDVYVFPQPRYASKNTIDPEADDYILNYKPWITPASNSKSTECNGERPTRGKNSFVDGYWSSSKLNVETLYDKVDLDGNNQPDLKADSVKNYEDAIAQVNNLFMTNTEYQDLLNYRKISNVYKRLTIQQLEEIGTPKSAMLDNSDYTYQFSGWTANKSIAETDGYGGMKSFDYIDSLVPLSTIDSTDENGNVLYGSELEEAIENKKPGIDGSLIGDTKIFIFPIFAIGKDYKLANYPQSQPTSIDLVNGTNYDKTHNYLPVVNHGGNINNLYEKKNIYFSEEDEKNDNNYTFSIDVPLSQGGWQGHTNDISKFTTKKLYAIDSTIPSSSQLKNYPIISQAGYYNVYTKVAIKEVWSRPLLPDQTVNTNYVDYGEASNEDYLNNYIKEITSNIVNHSYTSGVIQYKTGFGGYNTYTAYIHIWTWVERVYEYKITGGPADTFDYYSLSAPLIFYSAKSPGDVNYTEIYTSENIYFNSDELSFKYKYPSDQSSTGYVINQFKETVFTLAADNSGVLYNLKIDKQTNIPDGYSGDLLEVPKPGIKIGPDVDYTYTYDSTYLNNKVLKVKEPGYYDFRFRVVYVNQAISEIYVSCRKVADVVAYVKLVNYVNKGDKFNRIQPLSGNFIDIEGKKSGSSESGPFDKAVSNYYNGTSNEFYYTTPSISTNTDFVQLNSITFDKIKSSTGEKVGEVSLATILGNNYELVDHTTGLTVDINSNSVIRLSHIFYIREKAKS